MIYLFKTQNKKIESEEIIHNIRKYYYNCIHVQRDVCNGARAQTKTALFRATKNNIVTI
jgi:hypothetical protein